MRRMKKDGGEGIADREKELGGETSFGGDRWQN